jgi:hypothetical protein
MNAAELAQAMLAAKADMDRTMSGYEQAIRRDAEANDISRREVAKAFLRAREHLSGKPTVDEVRAWVDVETAIVQREARMAEGLKRSGGMAVENARQWLSALQSLGSLTRAEAQIAAYEPREVA